jgi:hypothetical protein
MQRWGQFELNQHTYSKTLPECYLWVLYQILHGKHVCMSVLSLTQAQACCNHYFRPACVAIPEPAAAPEGSGPVVEKRACQYIVLGGLADLQRPSDVNSGYQAGSDADDLALVDKVDQLV